MFWISEVSLTLYLYIMVMIFARKFFEIRRLEIGKLEIRGFEPLAYRLRTYRSTN